jgi:hypothetical protein
MQLFLKINKKYLYLNGVHQKVLYQHIQTVQVTNIMILVYLTVKFSMLNV